MKEYISPDLLEIELNLEELRKGFEIVYEDPPTGPDVPPLPGCCGLSFIPGPYPPDVP